MKKEGVKIKVYGWGSRSIWRLLRIHFTIHFKTMKAYNDFYNLPSWIFKFLYKIRLFGPHYNSPMSISCKLTKATDFKDEEIKRAGCTNLEKICEEVEFWLGRKVKYDEGGEEYILNRLELTQEDYYYILYYPPLDSYVYPSCVGGIRLA